MLTIYYCPKDNCEFTNEEKKCEFCKFFAHIMGYFGCDWYECIFSIPMEKEEYKELIERLQIGL